MANSYQVVTQYETVEFLGGTQTQPVIAVGVRTVTHGVYFEFRLVKTDYNSANVQSSALGFTTIYEMLFQIPGVTDAEWTQEPTQAGQLQDHVVVYFTSTSGNSSASIDFPYSEFTQDYIAYRVGFAITGLDASEAGDSVDQGAPESFAAFNAANPPTDATAPSATPPTYGITFGPPAGQRASSEPGQGVIAIN